jgi:hypothetical protein
MNCGTIPFYLCCNYPSLQGFIPNETEEESIIECVEKFPFKEIVEGQPYDR